MNAQRQSSQQVPKTVIVGLGTTGLSVAHFLASQQREFVVVDSRENPPGADDLKREFAHVYSHFGSFNTPWLEQAEQLVVNPGISISTPEIQKAEKAGAELVGDIELFAREIKQRKPIIAITGSNGKTTVTRLLDLMAKKSGVKVSTGGNIGRPALDLLADNEPELFVLELSSYQLETTTSLHSVAAVILNVSEDHLDRYENDIEKYARSKAVIYNNCEHVVCNREDVYSMRFAEQTQGYARLITFGLDVPKPGHFGVCQINDEEWLCNGNQPLIATSQIKLPGKHNISNALSALALGEAAGLKMTAMLEVLTEFTGIEHRTQWICEHDGVNWYNDSKGTNVGATLAALSGLPGKTVLIAGGQGKGADFLPLRQAISEKARAVILMGEDAEKIAAIVEKPVPVVFVNSMQEAVSQAQRIAVGAESDNVLLSPACASFDMFKNYEQRGNIFIAEVGNLTSIQENKTREDHHG